MTTMSICKSYQVDVRQPSARNLLSVKQEYIYRSIRGSTWSAGLKKGNSVSATRRKS